MKKPLSINVNTFGTGRISEDELIEKIERKFDLTPDGIIEYLELNRPIFSLTTNYGHFGKEGLSWEKIIEF